MSKCHGFYTARKLWGHGWDQNCHDKQYKKAHLGITLKANPFGGAFHAKEIVLEKVGVETKQPNAAIRKCFRSSWLRTARKKIIFLPNDGCLNFTEENDFWLLDLVAKVMLSLATWSSHCQSCQFLSFGPLWRQKGKTKFWWWKHGSNKFSYAKKPQKSFIYQHIIEQKFWSTGSTMRPEAP